jgi:hypothetical protein
VAPAEAAQFAKKSVLFTFNICGETEPLAIGAIGVLFTVTVFELVVVPQLPPEVVSVSVTVLGELADAVYVEVFGVEPPLFAKDPPAPPSDHIAEVALPPNEPPKATVVPP